MALPPPQHLQGSSIHQALLPPHSRVGGSQPALQREALCRHVGWLAALGKASSCRGCGAQSLGLEIQPELWVRGKPAAPRGAPGLILDLAASHFVTQRSPQTDSRQLPPSQGRVGCTTTKTTAMIIMTASIYYMFFVFQMMYPSATLLCITSSNHLPALCDRIWMIFAFYC